MKEEIGKYVILNWNSIEDISLAYNEDGSVMIFETEKEAKEYAEENFAWNWKVVEVE